MIDILEKIFSNPFGSAGFVFAVLVSIGWTIFFLTKHITKIRCSHNTLKKSTDKMESNIDEIRKDLKYCCEVVSNIVALQSKTEKETENPNT